MIELIISVPQHVQLRKEVDKLSKVPNSDYSISNITSCEGRAAFGVEVNEVVTIAISFTSGVGVNIFSSWLYEKIKGDKSKLIVDKTRIENISITSINNEINIHLKKTDKNV